MSSMYDLSHDLVGEILSRVPMTSLGAVRSTCKLWNTLSKDPSFKLCVKAAAKDIMLITRHDSKVCLMSVNLHNHQSLVDPFIKQIGKLKQVKVGISELFYCNGLLLCVGYDEHDKSRRLVVCNPYTGQTRWFQPRNIYGTPRHEVYGMGYDSNNHYKILRICYWFDHKNLSYEIYDLKTKSWRILDVTMDRAVEDQGVSLKGNYYFITEDRSGEEEPVLIMKFLLCFDFTRERFWSVPLPCCSRWEDSVILSAVREEKLAVLSRRCDALEVEIWITNKIDEPNAVSWSCLFKVDKIPIYRFQYLRASFFVDEKEKVAVVFYLDPTTLHNYKACMVEEGGHYYRENSYHGLVICSSYVPSLVQIQ